MKRKNLMRQLCNYSLFCYLLALSPATLHAQACMELIWSDEFNGTELNSDQWSYEIGDGCPDLCGFGNNEEQYYTDSPENIMLENGRLIITGKEDTLGGLAYSSAKIYSKNKGDFRYGRIEARMKFPTGQGVWPAFWMLSTEDTYGGWPESGEIDIVEMIGSNPGQVVGTMHTGEPHTFISGYYNLPPDEILADDFHIYSIEWEPDSVTFFFDGIQYHQLTPDILSPWAPFQEDFYLILNLALGGNWPGPVDETTELPQTLEVDYVRVYNHPERLPIRGEQPIVEAVGLEYSTFEIEGANYIWTVPQDASIISGQGTHQITVDWGCTAGNVDLELQTSCETVFLSYEVESFITPDISGPITVTENQADITFNVSQTSGGSFSWEVPSGANIVSGQGTNQIAVEWGCEPGDVTYSLMGSCGSSFENSLSVSLQTIGIIGQPSVPPNTANRTYSIADIPGSSYSWTVPSDVEIVSGQGTPSIQVDFGVADAMITVLVENSCWSNTFELLVAVEESLVYADFDEVDMDFIPRYGAVWSEVANPSPSGINTSALVGRVNKTPGSPYYAGIEANVYEIPTDLRPLMAQKVYSSSSGIVRFLIDDLTTGQEKLRINVEYGPNDVNQWVQLVYDFSEAPTDVYDEIGMRYNHGSTSTEFWYFDDVMNTTDAILSAGTEIAEDITEVIAVYPNPSSGQYFLDSRGIFPTGSNYTLEVMDTQGRSILKQHVVAQGQLVDFDLSTEPSGVYVVNLSGQSLRYAKVIVKQ
ncbi:family 16 glycosylhydrolase [Cryomorphaceae bacterium 1068]|nr:family 16 glycosylhydrolase [Cryomorphaceae bacterium 1068]